jgi:hypothetical protein
LIFTDDFWESADFVNCHATSRLAGGSTSLTRSPTLHLITLLFGTNTSTRLKINPSHGSETSKSLPIPESPFATAAGTSRTSADGRQLRHASLICMPSLGNNNGPTHPGQLSEDDIRTTNFWGTGKGYTPQLSIIHQNSFRLGFPSVVTHVS